MPLHSLFHEHPQDIADAQIICVTVVEVDVAGADSTTSSGHTISLVTMNLKDWVSSALPFHAK
jgi:hypothetical protein